MSDEADSPVSRPDAGTSAGIEPADPAAPHHGRPAPGDVVNAGELAVVGDGSGDEAVGDEAGDEYEPI